MELVTNERCVIYVFILLERPTPVVARPEGCRASWARSADPPLILHSRSVFGGARLLNTEYACEVFSMLSQIARTRFSLLAPKSQHQTTVQH